MSDWQYFIELVALGFALLFAIDYLVSLDDEQYRSIVKDLDKPQY